jgi:beta-galactosidase/beta-glucuronidase
MRNASIFRKQLAARCTGFLKLSTLAVLCAALSLQAQAPRPEHPRPDAFRDNWMTLNGLWQFEIDDQDDGVSRGLVSGHDLNSKIIVPFAPESKLSGIGHYDIMKHLWYRRAFEVPYAMHDQRVLLHFGGVYYRTWVYVNGQLAGEHDGGSLAFDFDITKLLRGGSNELVVHVYDDVASGKQPSGKQTHTKSEGCVYTRTSGMWQTVWLEGVGSSYVQNYSITPDPDNSRVLIDADVNGSDPDLTLTAEAFADGHSMGKDSTPATWQGNHLVVPLRQKHLWQPGSPFLYDLKFTLKQKDKTVDEVKSYFGLRKISIDGRSILINGKHVFQRLILDQGFYPDGIWTAPSDAELKGDIERSLAAGFNGARLHQKVFEPRYLYWADKLGYLVWGEFPNWGFDYNPADYSNFINEWTEELVRDRNHPAIIGWCPFNETGGNAGELQQMIWKETKAMDPTRPIIESSGWAHTLPNPEVLDAHDYNQDPIAFGKGWINYFTEPLVRDTNGVPAKGDPGVPFMISEFGGIGWATEGGWGYGNGPKTLAELYLRYQGLVDAQLDNPHLFGFCYTQLTDVEQEHNGLYYYDRRPKFDLDRLHEITSKQAAYERLDK